ncbi:hypothetical protein KUTeg_005386, partial [Tegillarca granosa]
MVPKMFVFSSSSKAIFMVYLITLTLPCGSRSQTYRVPGHVYSDLAKSVNITASCNQNDVGCNPMTCPRGSRKSMTTNNILELNDGNVMKFGLALNVNNIRIGIGNNGILFSSHTVSQKNWHHVFIRKTAVFIDGEKVSDLSLSLTNVSGSLEIKSGNILSGYLQIADVRLYDYTITDREIQLLFNGRLAPNLLDTECRCPNDYPRLNDSNDPQGILCKKDKTVDTMHRLNTSSHIAGFANDGDRSTSWISGPTENATLTLFLDNVVQILSITITLKTQPRQTTISMLYSDSSRIFILSTSDICNCYGNSDSCVRVNGERKLTCQNCNINTYTTGSACEKCKRNYYRQPSEFGCGQACLCSSDGIIGNDIEVCEEVGGQCPCKSNVVGRRCVECKHLTYSFNSSNTEGCTNCTCDPFGSKSCDITTGACVCKNDNYYDTSVSDCSKCKPEFYGRQKTEGCVSCNCNINGVVDNNKTCHEFSGSCYCKSHVEGQKCDTCKGGYYGLDRIQSSGCKPCTCNIVGSVNQICDKTTGQCHCRNDIQEKSTSCNPEISKVEPEYGPFAGGTIVEVQGKLFGNDVSVVDVFYKISAGDTSAFTLKSVNDTNLVFETKKLNQSSNGEIIIRWKRSLKTTGESIHKDIQLNHRFQMKPNPKVTKATSMKTFKTFSCDISIEGLNLDSVYKPRLVCSGLGNTVLKCGVPDLTVASNGAILSYGLVLDGFQTYSNLTSMFSSATITVFDDPKINNFDDEFRNVFMKTVTIKGSGFTKACSKSDFKVMIGDAINCAITEFTDMVIKCEPSVEFPGVDTTEDLKLYIGDKSLKVGKIKMVPFTSTIEFIGIAVGVGVFILLVIILIVVIKCCCCRKDNKQTKTFSSMEPVRDQLKLSLIKRTDVEVEKRCTKRGSEIRIIDGKYSGRKSTMKTLIKTISSYHTSEPFYKLMQLGISECLRLRDCFHDNILQIYGFSVDQDKFYVIYPTTRRILKDHLNDIKGQTFQVVDLVRMCKDVGEGIAYLDKENIVHKDIATRNCFVTDDGTVKICDASFSWDLFPKEYMYDKKKERYIPVRWMAPECLQSSFYDKKTDVWSFGVLMWEMMSRSIGLPYWDVKDDERISSHVRDGNRLGKPANTPDN